MKRFLKMFLVAIVLIMTTPVALAEAVNTAPAKPLIDLTALINAALLVVLALIKHKLTPLIEVNTTVKQQAALKSAVRLRYLLLNNSMVLCVAMKNLSMYKGV